MNSNNAFVYYLNDQTSESYGFSDSRIDQNDMSELETAIQISGLFTNWAATENVVLYL